jgi:hypothetical protein
VDSVQQKRVIGAQVSGETAAALERLSAAADRTLSAEIRIALREHLSRRHPPRVHTPDRDLVQKEVAA